MNGPEAKGNVSAVLDFKLVQKLHTVSVESGMTKTAIIEIALQEYLNKGKK